MTKKAKIKICNLSLLVLGVLVLVSGIQLEATSGRLLWNVWLHILVGILFFIGIVWHIVLHFGWKQWTTRFRKLKSPVTHVLAIAAAVALASAVPATLHWMGDHLHSPVGAVHGKIGFLMLAVAIGHTVKRFRYFKKLN